MKKIADIIAKGLSILFYPLFVPTFGIALFCYAYAQHVSYMPAVWTIIAIAGTFLLTCLLPLSVIWWLMRRGEVKDMQIEDAKERKYPYLYTILGFGFWAYFVSSVLHAPLCLVYIACGATVAIGIVTLINKWWKISAHLTGFGGLTGGIFCYCLGIGALPTVNILSLVFGLSLLLMYARLRLHAHTPAQVCAGWLLGITCTFIPYCIASYAL